VPHGVIVVIDEFKDEKTLLKIRATIICEREGHKPILIGHEGAMLKKIGTFAREDMERFFNVKVFLDLWIKIKEDWKDNDFYLKNIWFGSE